MRLRVALISALAAALLAGCHPTEPPSAATDAVPLPTAVSSATPAEPGTLCVPPTWEAVQAPSFTALTLHPIDEHRCVVLGSSPTQGEVMSNEIALLDCEKGMIWHVHALGTDGTGPTVRKLRFLGITADTVVLSFDDPDPKATVYDYGRGSVGLSLKDGSVRWTSERYKAAYDTVGHLLELPQTDAVYDFLSTEQSKGQDFLELVSVRARRVDDGKELWNTLLGDVRDVVDAAVTPEALLCATSKDAAYALRRTDGRLLHHWQQNGRGWLDGDRYWYAADDGLHLMNVGTYSDRLLGGDSAEGLAVGRRDGHVVFFDHRGTIAFVDSNSLAPSGTMSLPQEYGVWRLGADHVLPRYVPWASDDSLSAIDLDGRRVLWTRELASHFVPTHVEQIGNRFVLLGRDSLSVFDGETGQIVAARHLPGTSEDPPMVRTGNAVWAASGAKLLVYGLPGLNVLRTNAPDWKPEDVAVNFRPH